MIWPRGHMSLDALTVTPLTLYSAVYVLWPHRIEDATYSLHTLHVPWYLFVCVLGTPATLQKWLNQSRFRFRTDSFCARGTVRWMGRTLTPPGEYD